MHKKVFLFIFFPFFSLFLNFSHASEFSWQNYYQNSLNYNTAQKTLRLALSYFQWENKKEGRAADLGAGAGIDTKFLLNKGWDVFAMDKEQLSIDIILEHTNSSHLSKLEVMVCPFSEMVLPSNLDLINASFSLPFCHPQDFPKCWRTVVDQLSVGGRFAGQFFGEKDEWAIHSFLTILSYESFLELFKDQFVIEYLQIEEGYMPQDFGQLKKWQVFHVVAKKIK